MDQNPRASQDEGVTVTIDKGAVLSNPIERWELNPDDVKLGKIIGEGNFGVVYEASLRPSGIPVAVKMCKVDLPEEQRNFLREARILKQYNHPNVVRLVGVSVQEQPIMIVMEFIPDGSLLSYLKKRNASLTAQRLVRMSRDCAAGMTYLASQGCIHRDLAARNCLVGKDDVKISDFGLSREGDKYYVTQGLQPIPIKWTAPEALHFGRYSSLSDVWSFGILLWEIFSLGQIPYGRKTNREALEEIDKGYRLPAPDRTPSMVYKLMLRCWKSPREQRPNFDEIHRLLENIEEDLTKKGAGVTPPVQQQLNVYF